MAAKIQFGYWNVQGVSIRFFDCLLHPNKGISTLVNGTMLNFGKRYKDNLWVIFDQWPKLHLGLDALSNQKMVYEVSNYKWKIGQLQAFSEYPNFNTSII